MWSPDSWVEQPVPIGGRRPSATACRTAIKLLTQFESQAQGQGVTLPPARVARLRSLGGAITSYDLPATLRAQFPGEFAGMALAELPDMVRGYEQIKLENVRRYREAARQLLAQLA